MDARHGPRSGDVKSQETANQSLNGCLSRLAVQIGNAHDIPPKDLAKFFGHRSLTVDIAVILRFVLFYCVFAAMLGGRLRWRYPLEAGRQHSS
jgi:hypothetical protein